MKPIRLFRFPHLVLDMILHDMELPEIFFLRLCSSHTKKVLKTFRPSNYKLTLKSSDFGVEPHLLETKKSGQTEILRIKCLRTRFLKDDPTVMLRHYGQEFWTVFKKHPKNTTEMITYWKDLEPEKALFNVRLFTFLVSQAFSLKEFETEIQSIIDLSFLAGDPLYPENPNRLIKPADTFEGLHLQNSKLTVKRAGRLKNRDFPEVFDKLLAYFKQSGPSQNPISQTPAKLLILKIRSHTHHKYLGELPKVEKFWVKDSSWLARERLLSLESEVVILENSELFDWEMNMFLEDWKKGKLSKLRYFQVELRTLDMDQVMDEIEGPVGIEEEDERRNYEDTQTNTTIQFTGQFVIARDDGMTATIYSKGMNGNARPRLLILFGYSQEQELTI